MNNLVYHLYDYVLNNQYDVYIEYYVHIVKFYIEFQMVLVL